MLTKFLILLSLAATITPTASAWGVNGSSEPDTRQDATGGWMFQGPDQAPTGSLVYFNGITSYCLPPYGVACQPTSLSLNVALLGTRVEAYPTLTAALLGVWKDCNKDGYIGAGDPGLFEYRSELLLDGSICPVQPIPHPIPYDWHPVHNDGSWVRELIPIGWNDWGAQIGGAPHDANPFDINDTNARVWADDGVPGDPPGGFCHTYPVPRGTEGSTGGLLKWADCFDSQRTTAIIDATTQALGVPELGFSDSPSDPSQSSSPLNIRSPYGHPGDRSVVTATDCATAQRISLTDLHVPGVGGEIWVPGTAGPTADPTGTPAGTVREAGTSALLCDAGTSEHVASAPYALEGDVQNGVGPREQTDHSMSYVEGSRPSAPTALVGEQTPPDLGLRATNTESYWVSDDVTALSSNPFFDRNQLGFSGAQWRSYYAFVSPSVVAAFNLRLPSSVTGSYGSEACGSRTMGVFNGWDCDARNWWPHGSVPRTWRLGPDPSRPSWPMPYGIRAGAPYDLRDIDCYDESANGARDAQIGYQTPVSGSFC